MSPTSRATVLIVEDDPAVRALLIKFLDKDWNVLSVSNGQSALDVAAKNMPDLILLDIGLPDIEGFDVCLQFKDDPQLKSIPIIFLTSHASPEFEIKGFDVGGVDYVPKPINPRILRVRVRNHIELKQNRDALERLARLDGLTGLINRRSFDTAIDREWRRSLRTQQSISVIMMDVDFFKQFNDTYGHAHGDDCLKKVAAAAEGSLQRPADLVARYGGEEFVALLPDTTPDGAKAVADGIRTSVIALQIPHSESKASAYVTISAGFATTVATNSISPADLVEVADSCLYAAKKNGRNRVEGKELSP